jgi:hypothetical protein
MELTCVDHSRFSQDRRSRCIRVETPVGLSGWEALGDPADASLISVSARPAI